MHRRFHRAGRVLPAVLALVFCLSAAAQVSVEFAREEAGESYVQIPSLSGMDNVFVQDSVNAQIREAAQAHLNTLLLLASGTPGSLETTASAVILPSRDGHDLLSVLLNAQGRMPSGRTGQSHIPLMFDLANGQKVSHEALFADAAEAVEAIESDTAEAFADSLSNYLNIEDLFPFPLDRVLITETGLSFYYPDNSLTWLSGRSASIHYLYHELEPLLDLGEGSLLFNLGVRERLAVQPDTPALIAQAAAEGCLPGLDARLDDPVSDLVQRHSLLYDPEGFPEGEKYQLEDDRYRGTVLIARDGGLLSGILSRRMNLYGLITGRTGRDEALNVLGSPASAVTLDSIAGDTYGLPAGELVAYAFGENELRLFFDSDGLLHAVWLYRAQ